MNTIGTAPRNLHAYTSNFSIEAISRQVDPTWVQEALVKTGRQSKRVRKLPADLVMNLLVAMGLHPHKSIPNVLKDLALGFRGKLEKSRNNLPTTSAITQARDRLGVEPVKVLFERQAAEISQRHDAQQRYKGMPLVGWDGSSLKVPDTPENRKVFGAPKSGRGRSAFPMMRVVLLLAVATHIAVAAALGPWATGEMTLAMSLLGDIRPGSLVLMDRGFISYFLWWSLLGKDCHFLTRSKRKLKLRKLRKLGEGDWLVKGLVPKHLRSKHSELPESLTLRLIRYRVPGFRTSWLITSLLDPERYPQEELVALYHARWELELAYSEIKVRLRPSGRPLRSEAPERVRQEAYGLLLAYNAVRGLIAEAATPVGVQPLRLSFTDSLHRIRTAILRMAEASAGLLLDLYQELLSNIAACRLPPRRTRHNPRVIKVKMSKWPLKRKKSA